MKETISILLFVIEFFVIIYFVLATALNFFFSVSSLFYKNRKNIAVKKIRKFAVLIPAYKEDDVILDSVNAAIMQNYPADAFEVIVICDSFKETTIDVLKKLPINVVIVNFDVGNKAKSLNYCMNSLSDNYDAAFILDADNILESDGLDKMNMAFERGFVAVQGHRTAKNLNTNYAILDAISEEINNSIFRKGHVVLGLSSSLIGSGLAVDYQLFKKYLKTIVSVAEDKEIELLLIRDGFKIDYIDDLLVLDEKTSKSKMFLKQRRRWISSKSKIFKEHFGPSIKLLIKNGNFDYFDKVVKILTPPRIILLGLLFIISFLSILISVFDLVQINNLFISTSYLWIGMFVITVVSLLLALPKKHYNKKTFYALYKIPNGFVIMLLSFLKLKSAAKASRHTQHNSFN